MMNVCQKCGDKGDSKRLVYCVQCRISAEHRYCLDELPNNDEEVIWTCEECIPKDAKLGSSAPRKSGRISLRKERTVEVRMNRKRQQNGTSTVMAQVHMDRMAKATQLTCNISIMNEEIKNLPPCDESCGNQMFKKHRRKLVLEDGCSSDEDSEPVKVSPSESAQSAHDGPLEIVCDLQPLESFGNVHGQPVFDPIWRDEKVYDGLLDNIIENNLAMKAVIDNVELLVFSSRELPEEHWRFRRKYYLWAVFRQTQVSLLLKQTDHLHVQNISSECQAL